MTNAQIGGDLRCTVLDPARIEVDGVDVSDETVGTTTENIPRAIDEFQISQSTLAERVGC